jgi:hypothetical protein
MGYLLKEHQLLYSEQSHLDVLPSLPIPIGQEVFIWLQLWQDQEDQQELQEHGMHLFQ